MSIRKTARDHLPLPLRAALVRPARKAVIGLSLVVAAGLVLAMWWVWVARPDVRSAPTLQRRNGVGSAEGVHVTPRPKHDVAGTGASRSTKRVVTIHVAGAVRRPGVVRLPAGSRVADAVERAGGGTAKAALASVNLARVLVDGEQVVVLREGEAGPPVAASAAGGTQPAGSSAAQVDLNTATAEQLDALPGVGPVLAQRILDWRTRNGRFNAVGELQEVAGIGDAKFADLEARVRV